MDRPLTDRIIHRNRLRTAATVAVPMATLATVLALLPGWMRPAVDRSRIRTAVVRSAAIDAVITASGTVVPDIERILSSPVDALLLRVLKRPGAAVRAGEPVAELDLGDARLALDRVDGNLAVTENKRQQARLALETALADLDARIERQALDVQMLEERAARSRRLADEGLVAEQTRREANLGVAQATIALAQLRRERANAERSTRLQAHGLDLEREALTKEAAVARRTLDLATTRSDRDGVVTWILSEEGSLVRRGAMIARIADLRAFRIDAVVSDVHSTRIAAGLPVDVLANDVTLNGTISDVRPTVENDVVRFTVTLQDPSHGVLRPSLRVDVNVLTDRRARTLTVRQGPFLTGAARGEAFVIRGGRAVRTAVTFGLRGADDVEVTSGLAEGDEVIISDMRDYLHLNALEVR